jgi:hypothetical protein
MDQKKVLPVFGFLFWLLSYSVSCSSTIVSPQEFTDEVYFCCLNNNFDRFLGWLQTTELPPMNRSFKETQVTLPSTMSELDVPYYRNWKEEYYEKFRGVSQTKSFLLAGEFYPAVQLLQSTALSFYELSPVIRTCVMLSGKMGNSIAKNILVLEGIDGGIPELMELLRETDTNDSLLLDLLQTPFVWNNINAMNFLKDPIRRGKVLGYVTGENPFIYLNGYFVVTELNLETATGALWLQRSKNLGSALAAVRLHQSDMIIDSTLPATVKESLTIQKAHYHRYGIEGVFNRAQAKVHYEEALAYAPMDPFLHMEIAEFYKDLYIAEAHNEIEMDSNTIVSAVLYHYRQAHVRGDGEAALETIKFILHLEEKEVALPFSNAWDLPQADIAEAFTRMYEAAYQRREESIFLERIIKLGKRTAAKMEELKFKAIRNITHRNSIIRFGI